MIQLFPDQQEVMAELRDAMRTHKSVLLQSPTGSGKTAMALSMIIGAQNKDKRTIFTVPRKQLLEQTGETFWDNKLQHGYIAAGRPFNPYNRTHIGMIDTMARRLDKLPDADLVIFDETHFGSNALDSVINHYKSKGAWTVGLSATPWKLSGEGLGKWYDHMVQGKSIKWLIDNKRLSDYRFFRGKTKPDLSQLSVHGGDYARGELAGFMEAQGVIIGDCVADYKSKAMGRLHVVRCASIKHSQMTAQAFRDAGVLAMHVDGETPRAELTGILKGYARRELTVLTFCDLLNFGFDLSQATGMDVCVESGSDLKPSKSLAGQMQYWGRMLRYKPEPALIFDNVNNYVEHGLPHSEREWTLESRKQGKKSTERVPPTRQCGECFAIHTPAPQCPECGHIYEIKSREIEEVDGHMEEIDKDAVALQKKEKRMEVGSARTMDDLMRIAKERGYKTGWAIKQAQIKGIR